MTDYRTDKMIESLNEAIDYMHYSYNTKKLIKAKKDRILKKQNMGFKTVTLPDDCISINDMVYTRILGYKR